MAAQNQPALNRKILYFAVDADATGAQRLHRPLELLKQRGARVELLNKNNLDQQLKDADLVLLQCLIGPDELPLVRRCKQAGVKVIVDYDDNFFALPTVVLKRLPWSQQQITETWIKYLQLADLVTVSCYSLADVVKPFVKEVFVLPNYLLKGDLATDSYNPFDDTSETRIMFSGSESHQEDFQWVCPVLKWIGEHYPQVRIITQGKLDFSYYCPTYKGKASHLLSVPYQSYMQSLREAKPHIFIAPLKPNAHSVCRSNLKFYQAGAIKAAFIGSDSPAYGNISHGNDGLLPAYRLTWWWYLRTLIRDLNFARNLGQSAFSTVQSNTLETQINRWLFAYETLIEDKPRAA